MSQFARFAPLASITSLSLGLLLLAAVGCNQSPGIDAQAVAAYRTSFTLADEPDGVQTVADVRSTLLGESADDHDHDHEDHDHDGDGIQDHAAADHDEDAHEDDLHQDHDAADHDEDGEDHEGHDEGHDHEAHESHDEHDHDHGHDHEHHAQATESMNVVMVGHIGGLANPWANTRPEFPFAKTQAIFYLADPLAIVENEESGHSHAPGEECAFCAAHAEDHADMLAMVQFVDKNGKVLPVDVRQLFDVKENDTVVVNGKAHVTAGGILVVDAHGLYIRN